MRNMDIIKEGRDQCEHDIITGDDCDDEGIADERFASPEVFMTDDIGRKSLELKKNAIN